MFTALESINLTDGKHLFGSLLGNGSVVVICAIAGVAVIAVVVMSLYKKKKGNRGEDEDE